MGNQSIRFDPAGEDDDYDSMFRFEKKMRK